jgi:hypothetical protein
VIFLDTSLLLAFFYRNHNLVLQIETYCYEVNRITRIYKQFILKKNIKFWNITPRSPLSVNRRFGGTYRFRLQGRRNKFSKKPASNQVASCFLAAKTSNPTTFILVSLSDNINKMFYMEV